MIEQRAPAPSGLRAVALTLLAVLLWNVAWYWRTAGEIAAIWWRSDTFGHGLVVLPVFAWLVWKRREAIGALRPCPAAWMALPAAAAATLWLLGELVSVSGAAHAGFVALLVFCMAGALGWRLARILSFPLVFLFFGLPVGEFLLPALMAMTADFTVASLRFSGIPVYQEGLQFVIPNGSWSVVEACSGIRYLIASLMLGALYAWLNYASLGKRLCFMAVAFAVPLLANGLRAYLIVLLGYLSNNRLATGVDHLIYGWVFFGIVIALMFWIGQRWADPERAVERAADGREPSPAPARWLRLASLALVSAAFVLVHDRLDQETPPCAARYELPAPATGWKARDVTRIAYRAHYAGWRGAADAVYDAPDGEAVLLQTAFFANQRAGAEMVTWENGLTDREGFSRSGLRPDPPAASALGALRSARLTAADGVRYLIWQWYVIGGDIVTRDWEAKLRLAVGRIAGRGDASMVFVLATPDDGAVAEARLHQFVAGHGAELREVFAGAEKGCAHE
ncbi:MAG: exosortase A [Azoarcus sp.]|nr:exosortase A [Azoarcus sp.]